MGPERRGTWRSVLARGRSRAVGRNRPCKGETGLDIRNLDHAGRGQVAVAGQEHHSVIEDDGPVWPGDLDLGRVSVAGQNTLTPGRTSGELTWNSCSVTGLPGRSLTRARASNCRGDPACWPDSWNVAEKSCKTTENGAI